MAPRSPRVLIQAADALLVVVAMSAAYILHAHLWPHVPFIKAPAGPAGFVLLAYFALPVWVVLVALLGLDRPLETGWSVARTVWRLLQLHGLGLAGLAAVLFATQSVVNRSIIATFLFLSFALMLALRLGLRTWARRQHARGIGRRRLLLVGEPGPAMRALVESLASSPFPPVVVGYLGRAPAPAGMPALLGTLGHLAQILHDEAVDSVVVLEQLSSRRAGWLVRVCADLGLGVSIPLPWQEVPRLAPHIDSGAGGRFLSFEFARSRTAPLAIKQVLDLVLGLTALVLLLPVLATIAVTLLFLDGRPVLFSQMRVGLHGRRFRMLKFRTMVKNADALKAQIAVRNEVDGPAFKVTGDPRITRFGSFLRRTSLDELPQIINVLEGSMSLVGPRPLPVDEQQRIRGSQRRRLSMKPGITGLWQVSGRSDLGFAQWMRLDQEYVDRWTLGLDLRLLLATIPAVLTRRGAR